MAFQQKIEEIYAGLTRAERQAADFFEAHAQQICRMPLKEICRGAGVSEPTVFRFCRAMGFEGIKDIKLYLAAQVAQAESPAPQETAEETAGFVGRILAAEQKILATTIRRLDAQLLEEAARRLSGAERIFFYGQGSSFLPCQDAARKLMRMQLSAWAIQDTEDLASQLRVWGSKAVLMCISHSGASGQVIQLMRAAQSHKAGVLLMTSYPQSAAAKHAALILQTYAMEACS
jgi:RpiR family carbohydrate utilization transcriptional regulator